jgi:hypothetical protein
MTTVTGFVSARLDEDEDEAEYWFLVDVREWSADGSDVRWRDGLITEGVDHCVARHIARHDPARVLAQCAAMRKIVEYHDGRHECSGPDDNNCMWIEHADDCPTMLALASIWSDHPDWREEWR